MEERGTLTRCSTHPCVQWLPPTRALTRDRTQNHGAVGRRSNQWSSPAGAKRTEFKSENVAPDPAAAPSLPSGRSLGLSTPNAPLVQRSGGSLASPQPRGALETCREVSKIHSRESLAPALSRSGVPPRDPLSETSQVPAARSASPVSP